MQKIKSFNGSSFLTVLKCVLLAIAITLIGIVILAVVLKFTDLNSTTINIINNVIKGLAIFFMMLCIKRVSDGKLLFKAIISGALYAFLSFIIFSILNGSFVFNLGFVYDLLFSVIVAIVASVILNIISQKSVNWNWYLTRYLFLF